MDVEPTSRSIGKKGASRGVPWKMCYSGAFGDIACQRLWDTKEKASPV